MKLAKSLFIYCAIGALLCSQAFAWDTQNLQGEWVGSDGKNYRIELEPNGQIVLLKPWKDGRFHKYRGQIAADEIKFGFKPESPSEFGSYLPEKVKNNLLEDGYAMVANGKVSPDGQKIEFTTLDDNVRYQRDTEEVLGIGYGKQGATAVTLTRPSGYMVYAVEMNVDPARANRTQELQTNLRGKEAQLAALSSQLEELRKQMHPLKDVLPFVEDGKESATRQLDTKLDEYARLTHPATLDTLAKELEQSQQDYVQTFNARMELEKEPNYKTSQAWQRKETHSQFLLKKMARQLEELNRAREYYKETPQAKKLAREIQGLQSYIRGRTEELATGYGKLHKLEEQFMALASQRDAIISESAPMWEELSRLLAPYEKEIRLVVDGQEKYRLSLPESYDFIKLNQEILEAEKAMEAAEWPKKEALMAFKESVDESRAMLEALHGQVSHGTGKMATLNDLINNDGFIMQNARASAAADFLMDLYELGEATAKGGMAGFIAEGIKKVGFNYIFGYEITADGVDPDSIEAELNEQFDLDITDPFSTPQINFTLLTRGADQVSGEMTVRTAGWIGKALHQTVRRVPAKVLQEQSNSLRTITKNFIKYELSAPGITAENFGKLHPGPFNRKEAIEGLAMGLAKDYLKAVIKKSYTEQEVKAWQKYFFNEIRSRALYTIYVKAFSIWDEAAAMRDDAINRKAEAVMQLKPVFNYNIEPNVLVRDGQKVTIISLPVDDNVRDAMQLGLVHAQPMSGPVKGKEHEFRLNVSEQILPLNSLDKRVKLTVYRAP